MPIISKYNEEDTERNEHKGLENTAKVLGGVIPMGMGIWKNGTTKESIGSAVKAGIKGWRIAGNSSQILTGTRGEKVEGAMNLTSALVSEHLASMLLKAAAPGLSGIGKEVANFALEGAMDLGISLGAKKVGSIVDRNRPRGYMNPMKQEVATQDEPEKEQTPQRLSITTHSTDSPVRKKRLDENIRNLRKYGYAY